MCNPERFLHRVRSHSLVHKQRCCGISLGELLVGLTVGLMVIASAIATLGISRATSASVSDLSQLQQQGSYALRIIGMQVRQAGSIEVVQNAGNGLYGFNAAPASALSSPAVSGIDGGDTGTDTVSVSYQPGLKDSQGRDCLGESISGVRAEGTFLVQNAELRCKTAGKNQALISNVADFQVWYRVRSASGDTQRMTATQVKEAALWDSIKSIEICLHLVGNETGHPDSSRLPGCQNESASRNGRLHLVFHNVFDLRSQGM